MNPSPTTPVPRALMIAGPNGAGKTTFAEEFLPAEGHCSTFINADLIAAALSPVHPESVAIEASRLTLEHVQQMVAKRQDFAVETTLAGRAYLHMIREWQSVGYQVELIFLQLPSADMAIERVRQRVVQGGHNIAEPDIRRRFDRGIENFHQHYRNAVNAWQIFDTSQWPPMLMDEAVKSCNKHPDMQDSRTAMIRAARRAAEAAKLHNQPLILWRDGHVVRIMPQDLPDLPKIAPRRAE